MFRSGMAGPTPPGSNGSSPASAGYDRILSALAVFVLATLAGAGAAMSPEGLQLGIPALGSMMFAGALTLFVWSSRVTGLASFLVVVIAAFVAAVAQSGAALLLFSGRPLYAFVFAGLVLAIAKTGRRPPHGLLFPAFFVIYVFVAYQSQTRVGPDGDEPQYLMVAQSIIQDGDLALDRDFQEKRYEAFFSRPLDPHFRIRGPEGQIYSLHAIGLSVLILPAYAALGYAGASFFMALLAALFVRELRKLLTDLTDDAALAEGTAWLIGLSPPIIHFAGLIFTEIPAALFLCVGLRNATFGRTKMTALIAALCAAALPWLNVRYAILALAVVAALSFRLWRQRRESADTSGRALFRVFLMPAAILIGSALAIGLYHFELWGFFDPRRVYGRRREFSLDILPEGLPGLFLDQEFGLLVYAPIFILALSGFALLWRRQRALAVAGLIAFCGVVATASVWPMWRGGFNPPARFLTPLVSVLACGLVLALQRGIRPATALLAGWSLWCGVGGALNIDTVHRDRDGVAPFFRTQSGAREWTTVLPSFVLYEDRPTRTLSWPWAILLCLPALGVFRMRRTAAAPNREALLATVLFMTTAVVAGRMTPRPEPQERDATRLLGRGALNVRSLRFASSSDGSWPLARFFEPHRHPGGMIFAQAIRLEPGRYSIELRTDSAGSAVPPSLMFIRRTGHVSRTTLLTTTAGGLATVFEITDAGEYDLALIGGDPASLEAAILRVVTE